jgi:hypothetical protein
MKQLWNVVNGLDVRKDSKARVFLWLLAVANILIGAGLWLLIGRIFLPGTEWLICFMGYPAIFIGFFGGILYLYNHEFA